MSENYRACYYVSPDGQSELVLTRPEHASLPEYDLMTEALAEAERCDLVGDAGRIPRQALLAGMQIGDWQE